MPLSRVAAVVVEVGQVDDVVEAQREARREDYGSDARLRKRERVARRALTLGDGHLGLDFAGSEVPQLGVVVMLLHVVLDDELHAVRVALDAPHVDGQVRSVDCDRVAVVGEALGAPEQDQTPLVAERAQPHVARGRLGRVGAESLLPLLVLGQVLDAGIVEARLGEPPRKVPAAHAARHAVGGGAHARVHALAALRELGGDLRAGLRGADHQRGALAELRGVPILRRVQLRHGLGQAVRPRGQPGRVEAADGADDRARADPATGARARDPRVAPAARHRRHVLVEAHVEAVVLVERLEVLAYDVLGHEAARVLAHALAAKAGQVAEGILGDEAERVPARGAPRLAAARALLEGDVAQAGPLQVVGGAEARLAGAQHDGVELLERHFFLFLGPAPRRLVDRRDLVRAVLVNDDVGRVPHGLDPIVVHALVVLLEDALVAAVRGVHVVTAARDVVPDALELVADDRLEVDAQEEQVVDESVKAEEVGVRDAHAPALEDDDVDGATDDALLLRALVEPLGEARHAHLARGTHDGRALQRAQHAPRVVLVGGVEVPARPYAVRGTLRPAREEVVER